MHFAYADPPYPGKAGYYAERQEVDHGELVARLVAEHPDGWALSTSAVALAGVLRLCPAEARVCAWLRSVRRTRSRRPLSAWEPLVVVGGREQPLDVVCDVADALVARGRFRAFPGAIVGMKPPAFAEWMFRQLGARRGDELADLFPGSGAVSLAWQRYAAAADDGSAVPVDARDASRGDRPHVSALQAGDASLDTAANGSVSIEATRRPSTAAPALFAELDLDEHA